jgi:hypothetical protein
MLDSVWNVVLGRIVEKYTCETHVYIHLITLMLDSVWDVTIYLAGERIYLLDHTVSRKTDSVMENRLCHGSPERSYRGSLPMA